MVFGTSVELAHFGGFKPLTSPVLGELGSHIAHLVGWAGAGIEPGSSFEFEAFVRGRELAQCRAGVPWRYRASRILVELWYQHPALREYGTRRLVLVLLLLVLLLLVPLLLVLLLLVLLLLVLLRC